MSQRVLITGVQSSLGRAVLRAFRERAQRQGAGVHVTGTGRSSQVDPQVAAALDVYAPCDLTNPHDVENLVAVVRPQMIYHLARVGLPSHAVDDPWCEQVALASMARAAQAHAASLPVRIVAAGSAAELGLLTEADLPVTEAYPCQPVSTYGWQKLHQTRWAYQEGRGPIEIVVARIFNLVGPYLSATCAPGRFARELAALPPGTQTEIRCGSLSPRRDFIDVRDAAVAMVDLAELGMPGEVYNVCCGHSHSMWEVCQMIEAAAQVRVRWLEDAALARGNDLPDVRGDFSKLRNLTSWQPRVSLQQSLQDLVTSIRPSPERLAKSA